MQLTVGATRCAVLAALAFCASAGNVRRAPVQLKPADAPALQPDTAWESRVGDVLRSENLMFVEAPSSGGEQDAMQQANGPVSMQVPEKELKKLTGDLSGKCREQFSKILNGKAAPIHTFAHAGENATEAKAACSKLDGHLCMTHAFVSQQKEMSGRYITSTVNVKGDGCLPSNCMGNSDLAVLATFMQSKAKSSIPGMGVDVQLNVDCSGSGGAVANVGSTPAANPAGAAAEPKHSSAAGMTVGVSMLIAAVSLAL